MNKCRSIRFQVSAVTQHSFCLRRVVQIDRFVCFYFFASLLLWSNDPNDRQWRDQRNAFRRALRKCWSCHDGMCMSWYLPLGYFGSEPGRQRRARPMTIDLRPLRLCAVWPFRFLWLLDSSNAALIRRTTKAISMPKWNERSGKVKKSQEQMKFPTRAERNDHQFQSNHPYSS